MKTLKILALGQPFQARNAETGKALYKTIKNQKVEVWRIPCTTVDGLPVFLDLDYLEQRLSNAAISMDEFRANPKAFDIVPVNGGEVIKRIEGEKYSFENADGKTETRVATATQYRLEGSWSITKDNSQLSLNELIAKETAAIYAKAMASQLSKGVITSSAPSAPAEVKQEETVNFTIDENETIEP